MCECVCICCGRLSVLILTFYCLRNFVLLQFIECFKLLVSQKNNVCVCVCVRACVCNRFFLFFFLVCVCMCACVREI